MTSADLHQANPTSAKPDAIDEISEQEFVEAWKAIVGEPPAVMLESRADMVKVLVESVPIAKPDPAAALDLSHRPEPEMPGPDS